MRYLPELRRPAFDFIIVIVALSTIADPSTCAARAVPLPPDWRATETPDRSHELVSTWMRRTTGIEFAVFESYIRRRMIRTDTPYGLKVRRVVPDSPAAVAGLRHGDVLLTWNDEPIETLRSLRSRIVAAPGESGHRVTFARLRSDRSLLSRDPWCEHDVTITLDDGAMQGRNFVK